MFGIHIYEDHITEQVAYMSTREKIQKAIKYICSDIRNSGTDGYFFNSILKKVNDEYAYELVKIYETNANKEINEFEAEVTEFIIRLAAR